MLERARRKGLETVLAEIEAMPFGDATFVRILLVDAFHHVRDQTVALRELLRVLKPDGRLVIEEPDIRRLPVKIVAALERLCLMRSERWKPRTSSSSGSPSGATLTSLSRAPRVRPSASSFARYAAFPAA